MRDARDLGDPQDIQIWNDLPLRAGLAGRPQRCFNVLGCVSGGTARSTLSWSLNGGPAQGLSLGPNGNRLARPGDFNVEVPFERLKPGENRLHLVLREGDQVVAQRSENIDLTPVGAAMPCTDAELGRLARADEAVQVIDGRWIRTASGLRTADPYYDRVLGIGDTGWRDYEVSCLATLHAITEPDPAVDEGANVVHLAIALRWPGHDGDENQPHKKWFPLGVTCEFRRVGSDRFAFRMLDPSEQVAARPRLHDVPLPTTLRVKARVQSVGNASTHYACKAWLDGAPEPADWDLEHMKTAEDVASGGALLIAHYTDVTFHGFQVRHLPPGKAG